MARSGVEGVALRSAVLLGGIVPFAAGLAGMIEGAAMTGHVAADPALDSHVRYLSGLLFGIGIGFWSTVPRIETQGRRFRLLTAIVFTGGLGRLLGVTLHGWPPAPMVFGLVMELGVTPLLCLWQSRVERRFSDAGRT
jgi:hypothetical protein